MMMILRGIGISIGRKIVDAEDILACIKGLLIYNTASMLIEGHLTAQDDTDS